MAREQILSQEDRDWIKRMFAQLAEIGKTGHGYERVAYTPNDWQAKQLIRDAMEKAGLAVHMDAAGNLIGRLEGRRPELPAVVTGSHIDTVPSGGNFDGSVGVVGSLCAIRRILREGRPLRSMELWVFAGHESSRFGFAHLGSRSICGFTETEKWSKLVDRYGKTIPEVFQECGLDFSQLASCERDFSQLASFTELHIEQGPVLEQHHTPIGIVTDIAAPIRLSVQVKGMAAHSGTTPMDNRHDALAAAARMVLSVRERARSYAEEGIVGTVGYMQVKPNAMNIIPGEVEFWIDVRGRDFSRTSHVIDLVRADLLSIAREEKTNVSIDTISVAKPVHLNDHLIQLAARICEENHIPYLNMVGGGGHDTQEIARRMPAVVLHIPCRNGVSHAPDEFASLESIYYGVKALTALLACQANAVSIDGLA